MPSSTDVAIIGGGAIGSAVAYFLLSDPAWKGRVTVVERDPTYRRASSALSASSIRQQFSTPENIRMSRFGFAFLAEVGRHLAVGGEAPEIGLTTRGYLYLATPGHAAALRENHAIQRAERAEIALLSPAELAARFPWMSFDGVALGSLGLAGEGWFDGYGLMQAFRRKAKSLGAVYLDAEAAAIRTDRSRVTAVRLANGDEIACGALVNAAGPWARAVAAMAGIPLPVEARRRCIFVFDARRTFPDCPLVIDPSGVFFRAEGAYFIAGTSPPKDEDLHELPLEVDHRLFDDVLWPALAARVPAFEAIKPVNAWAGYYEYNTFDQNAVLGPHPEIANFFFANGFSGHGIQQSPAAGRAVAELIAHGRFASLDLSIFGYARIAAGRPVVEKNVIG
ncbi:MAG: FAD-binding oxidoreductase [Candidatus Odyssella sp.]|nr:FAD-binding oxidoreductase [Candidatus Odyssella sp.]